MRLEPSPSPLPPGAMWSVMKENIIKTYKKVTYVSWQKEKKKLKYIYLGSKRQFQNRRLSLFHAITWQYGGGGGS